MQSVLFYVIFFFFFCRRGLEKMLFPEKLANSLTICFVFYVPKRQTSPNSKISLQISYLTSLITVLPFSPAMLVGTTRQQSKRWRTRSSRTTRTTRTTRRGKLFVSCSSREDQTCSMWGGGSMHSQILP